MKTAVLSTLAAFWLLFFSCGCGRQPVGSPPEETAAGSAPAVGQVPAGPASTAGSPEPAPAPAAPFYAFELPDIDGRPLPLSTFRGRVLLLVNVASKCGYTRQYAGLQALYDRHRTRGLAVLAFPANDFGAQEPAPNDQIKLFCTTTYNVTFPLFAKIAVKGPDIHPLYRFLTDPQTNPRFSGDIAWNFTKFLISRDGQIIGRYPSATEPDDPQLLADIENALSQTP
jgi:glutathione peroxidase